MVKEAKRGNSVIKAQQRLEQQRRRSKARAVFQLLPKTGYQRMEGVEMKCPDYSSFNPFISCQCFPLAEPNQNPEREQSSGISLLGYKAGREENRLLEGQTETTGITTKNQQNPTKGKML